MRYTPTQGCDEFDELYGKIKTAQNTVVREKCEGDLKARIKKLQRLRDDLKAFLKLPELREKKEIINDYKRKVEDEMEKFKEWEKDSKTKEFSKEGLAKINKVDKKMEEKQRSIELLNEYLSKLSDMRLNNEAELEKHRGKKKVEC